MNNLYDQLILRKQELLKTLKTAEQKLAACPEGKLRAAKTKSGIHYFHVTTSDNLCGKYITKSNRELISQLANKGYLEQVIKRASDELNDINRLLAKQTLGRAEEVYSELNDFRKSYVSPILLTDDEFVTRWEMESFNTNPYRTEEKIYETDRHEFVRSKSEMQIANILNQMGIPYRYEAELVLTKSGTRYPDFTLLKVRTREVIYYEHYGLMDDSGYRRENLQKIGEYCENGIVLGKNLIITFEAQGSPLNVRNIKRMLREMME